MNGYDRHAPDPDAGRAALASVHGYSGTCSSSTCPLPVTAPGSPANHQPFADAYARPAGQPESGFEASLFQALFLGNGGLVTGLLKPQPGNLLDRLTKLKDPEAAEEMFLSVLSRRPTAEECAAVIAFLKDRSVDRTLALQEMAWALIASAEFRFNH